MNRLTEKRADGRWAISNNDGASPTEQMLKIPIAIDRLAAYEDTGLTPEEIMALIPLPNDPLTLEELREMDGEPVWVVPLNDFDILPANYLVNAYAEQIVVDKFGAYLDFEDYGKTWLAYRRRPEEGTV